MIFADAFTRLVGNEGGYSNNPADPGGETMWGITARVARAAGYVGDMKAMPQAWAASLYQSKYWNAVSADLLPSLLRFEVFDAAVNSGVQQAIRWLQQAAGVQADGVLGPMTMAVLHGDDPMRLAVAFNAERLSLMTSLPTWPTFGRGWANRIAGNLRALATEVA
jgi:lysozyme family protein